MDLLFCAGRQAHEIQLKIDSSVTAIANVHSRKFYKMLESLELNSFQVTASA